MPNDYLEVRRDLTAIIALAEDLSNTASGRTVHEWRIEYGSYIFTKICCHALTTLKLSPTGPTPVAPGATEIWDLGSTCAVIRTLVDAYFTMYYLAVESIGTEERSFREAAWRFQGEHKRLSLLKLINSESPELGKLEAEVGQLRNYVLEHPEYAKLKSNTQRKVRKGELPLHLSNSELAERAGISKGYYRAVYRYLSSYIHTYPFAVSQLAHLRAGDPKALNLFATALQYCLAFSAFAIRDFRSLFPDLTVSSDPRTEELLADWIYVGGHFGESCPDGLLDH